MAYREEDEGAPEPEQERGTEKPNRPSAVVGLGVCAQSLRSLQELLAELGPELKAAYVVAVRQQEGLTVGEVVDALSRQTPLAVKVAEDGERLEANHVYVGGSDDMVALEDGAIRTRPAEQPIGQRGTIDTMLISLAEEAHDRAVAVVLEGLGSDGTAGVSATKKFGGLSIAEATPGEEDLDRQGATGPAGVVDLLLPIEEIGKQIALYVASIGVLGEAGPDELPERHAAEIGQIATILRSVTGNDFHGYKRNTFFRRIQRRMQVLQIGEIDDYVARLRGDREEVQHLFQDLLIGVTQFFRDPPEFEALERELPRLFAGKGPDHQVRVWVLGCATGEEAYSIGILLREHMASLDAPPHVQIFATDLDARALAIARAGRYSDSIAEHVRPDRLARWFVKEGETYCVSKELREMCIFSPHNIVKDAPFSRIDLLSCRNLLIYLNGDLQNRVIPIFHFSLRPGGVLFLGSSENVTRHGKLFAPVDRKNRVFRRLDTPTRVLPDFPLTARARPGDPPDPPPTMALRGGSLTGAVSRRAEAIAERYAPAYVVVDDQGDVLHFSGRTGRYLEPSAGMATLNVLNLVHRDLRLDLRAALHRAADEGSRVETPPVPIHRDGKAFGVSLIVEPVGGSDAGVLVVLFQDAGPMADALAPDGERLVSDEHVQRLEGELRLTKERLQATIEELESTNEELKSSNEEYQSINEELQSANEELETSKEELQSVNEELQTVNGELAHRVSELARTNSDLKNLLESTRIATVFLDNDLRVRNFTPAATDIFHLLESDVGRPIGHVASRITYPELEADVRGVLKTLASTEREAAGPEGRHYVARVLPYRSVDNFIAGAVVTFVDVTAAIRAKEVQQTLIAELQHRTRNLLAIVRSISQQTIRNSESLEAFGREFTDRLSALSRVQGLLSKGDGNTVLLGELVRAELEAHGADIDGDRVSIDGPAISLSAREVQVLTLALHELATNAVKYGALADDAGRIAVRWSRADGNGRERVEIHWAESGVDLPGDGHETRRGFGRELIERALPYDLGAETSFRFAADGVRCDIRVPVRDGSAGG